MSYQVFAVKTRPQSFSQVLGQEPVVSALTHALIKDKLHHAYLFTGTRGVGKTTIARIIAKALNCEQRQNTAEPCNQCANCVSIANGSFPDLIEIDAASRTKVEDTRALLDTVIYGPTQGKYKIYLIDEVHMLSTHSFNALLKTLEEPPSYVKFLFATTNVEKIPATILSRCLQFVLKSVSQDVIAKHISNLLEIEKIKYEQQAVDLLAQAAFGSLRDGLSLLEQAIAIGNGEVNYKQTLAMLGRTAGLEVVALLDHIINKQNNLLITQINNLALSGCDFGQLLTQLICVLHQIAVFQQAPEVALELGIDVELQQEVVRLSKLINPEDLQIYYQIALLAKRDLPYSPAPKLAVEMALIRMLKFVPHLSSPVLNSSLGSRNTPVIPAVEPGSSKIDPGSARFALDRDDKLPCVSSADFAAMLSPDALLAPTFWPDLINKLELKALNLQLVKNCEFVDLTAEKLILNLDHKYTSLLNPARQQEIEVKLQSCFKNKIKLIINIINHNLPNSSNNESSQAMKHVLNTPAFQEQEDQKKRYDGLVAKLQKDPNIKEIMDVFNGELKLDSVELID